MMKKIVLFVFITMVTTFMFAQTRQVQNTTIAIQDTLHTFKLYPTKNMWTFIKLDTSNGQMWQVQYAINDDSSRGEDILSLARLAFGNDAVNGRFCLYPTQNMYNFILLDQVDGRTWQVQWSFDYTNRGILPISE